MRLLLAALSHETNTFSPVPTRWEDFSPMVGDEAHRTYRHSGYAMAGLVGVIREFFGPGALSLGVDLVGRLDCDNWDNGVYQVGEGWAVVGRWGKGSESLAATVAPLHGQALAKYQGIMAQLTESLAATVAHQSRAGAAA